MISSSGFLEKGIECNKLKKYVMNQDMALEFPETAKYYEIDEDSAVDENSEEIEDEKINGDDILIYSTPNEEDISYLQFHIYNKEEEFYVHHDIYVYNTIIDSEYFKIGDRHLIGLATFESHISVYDSLIFNPLFPEIILKGHEDVVNCISWNGTNLFTGSNDNSIIKWDMVKNCALERYNKDSQVIKLLTEDNLIMFHQNKRFVIEDNLCKVLDYELSNEIECIKKKENIVYISDSEGYFYSFDLRNTSSELFKKKVHDEALTCFDINNDNKLITVSTDCSYKIFKLDEFKELKNKKTKEQLFSVKFCDYDDSICAIGGSKNKLKVLDLKNINQ